MSLPDPIAFRLNGSDLFQVPKIYSPGANQSVFRKVHASGDTQTMTFTQATTKTRKRHLVRLDNVSVPDINGNRNSVSFNLTIDEPLDNKSTEAAMAESLRMLADTASNVFGRLLNGEL